MTVDELRERTTLTIPEAGQVMGLRSQSAAYRAASSGAMPGVRQIGGKKMVSAPVLLAWLLDEDATAAKVEGEVRHLRATG